MHFSRARIEVWLSKSIGLGIEYFFFDSARDLSILVPFLQVHIDFARGNKYNKLISFMKLWGNND